MCADTTDVIEAEGSLRGKRIIVILGMHRSGTSVTTNLLTELGVPLSDDLMPPTQDNARGYFESEEISKIHDRLLELFGLHWDTPTTFVAMPFQWWKSPSVVPLRNELIAIVRRQLSEQPIWAFKDPRTARLLPVWHDIAADLGLDAKYVLVTRHPVEVVGSLLRRDRLDPLVSELLWLEHNADALLYNGKQVDAIVEYQDWIDKPFEQARYMIDRLGIPYGGDDDDLRAILARVVSPELRHQTVANAAYRLPFTGPFYTALRTRDLANTATYCEVFNISRTFANVISADLHRRLAEQSSALRQRDIRIASAQRELQAATATQSVPFNARPRT